MVTARLPQEEIDRAVEALRAGEYQTAIGLVAFDKQGERRGVGYSVLTWDGGRLKNVK